MLDIVSFLKKYISPDEKILIACSAGPDSMFLLYHLIESEYRKNIIVCYFNHETRAECDQEQAFLSYLGKKYSFDIEFSHYNFDNLRHEGPSKSFEELAREKRYNFFDKILAKYNASYMLTAHHFDDKIETFFFNLIRGTKLTGLINMTACSSRILRPMLHLKKSEILEYLHSNNLTYYVDESNYNTQITRNKLRLDIIPRFESINSAYKENIGKTMLYFEEIKQHLDSEVENFLNSQAKNRSFSLGEFLKLSPLLQKEVIRYIYYISNNNSTIGLSGSNIDEVIKFMTGKNNKTKKQIQGMNLFKDGDKILY